MRCIIVQFHVEFAITHAKWDALHMHLVLSVAFSVTRSISYCTISHRFLTFCERQDNLILSSDLKIVSKKKEMAFLSMMENVKWTLLRAES